MCVRNANLKKCFLFIYLKICMHHAKVTFVNKYLVINIDFIWSIYVQQILPICLCFNHKYPCQYFDFLYLRLELFDVYKIKDVTELLSLTSTELDVCFSTLINYSYLFFPLLMTLTSIWEYIQNTILCLFYICW